MAFIFDQPNKHIIIPSPSAEVTIQTIVNECRDFEDELINLDILPLVSAAWKEDLWWWTTVWITCTLLNGWKIKFEDRAWPTYIPCLISGGNLVSSDWSIPYTWSSFVTIGLSSSSSATNQNAEALEFASFWGAVNIDVNSTNSWIAYPVGNAEYKVNNIPDAVLIAESRWFNKLKIYSSMTLDAGDNVGEYNLEWLSHVNTVITVNPWANCLRTSFVNFKLTGTLDGDSDIYNCTVWDITYFNWHIHESYLYWTFVLQWIDDAKIDDCKILKITDTPIIRFWTSGQNLTMSNYSWRVILDDIQWPSEIGIWMNSWDIIINNTCTDWFIAMSWNWEALNNSWDWCYIVDKLVNWNQLANLQKIVEWLRPHHTWTWDIYYWNPYSWNDAFQWKTPDSAVKTFAQAHSLVKNANHDIIYCIPWDPSWITDSNENITISKEYLLLRGPWRDFELSPTDDSLPTVTITARGAEISWMRIKNSLTATAPAIHTTGDFSLFKNLWVANSNDWIHIENAEYCIIDSVKSHHNNWYWILIDWTSEHTDIIDCHIGSNWWDGININLDNTYHEVNILWDTIIHKNAWYWINISATTAATILWSNVEVFNNTTWNINDLGSWTYIPTTGGWLTNEEHDAVIDGEAWARKSWTQRLI